MLYLAEVQKKTGFIGGGKAEFKLIACQRSDTWTAVPKDEILPAPDDASYGAGALVRVELSNNRQVQRHYDAGRPLVGILQNFSNQAKKSKVQEEEIEQWKQSLTFQSQELNRRELEIESRQEQIEQAETDLEKLEGQRQELEVAQVELEKQQEELQRKNQELEGAWAHLNGELRRFEENQADAVGTAGLDGEQLQQFQAAIDELSGTVLSTDDVREQLGLASELLEQQHAKLTDHRAALAEQQARLEEEGEHVQQVTATLKQRWQEWHNSDAALNLERGELKFQQQLLTAKQANVQALSQQLQAQSNLYKQIYELLNAADKVRLSDKVDVPTLEAMPLEALQGVVADLEKDLEKVSHFVSDQEEELHLQQQAINEVKLKIEQASEFDRLQLETDLADEQDRYQMLNETLVGQRRNLLVREEILSQHQAILRRRQGLAAEDPSMNVVDLEPVLKQADRLRQNLSDELQAAEAEIKEIQGVVESIKQEIEQRSTEHAAAKDELLQQDDALQVQWVALGTLQGQSEFLATLIAPLEEWVTDIRNKLEDTGVVLAKLEETSTQGTERIEAIRGLASTFSADGSSRAVSA